MNQKDEIAAILKEIADLRERLQQLGMRSQALYQEPEPVIDELPSLLTMRMSNGY